MIIYEITQQDAQQGSVRHWARSKADVSKVKAKVRAEYRANDNTKDFNGFCEVQRYEIPPGKDGVVKFLNRYARFDNDTP